MARGIVHTLAWPICALHRIRVTVWESLYEPRAVTALMVCAYMATIVTGGIVIRGVPETGAALTATVLLIAGGTAGSAGAWRGAWWLEGPAAVLVAVGYLALGVIDLMITRGADHWPGFTVGVCVFAAIVSLGRAVRVWRWSYAPGRSPRTTLQEQATRTELSRKLTLDAEDQQRRDTH